MKKIILMLLTAASMSISGCAQKTPSDKVPAAVKTAFETKFPSAKKAMWEMESKTEYEVNFKINGGEMSANFDNTGKCLETEKDIKVSDLPEAIQSALKNDFKGFKIEEAAEIESLKDGKCYEAEIEKGEETFDVIFTSDGKVLSKTAEKEDYKKKD